MKFLMQRSEGKKIVHNAIFGMRFSCKSSPSIRYFAHFFIFTETRLVFQNNSVRSCKYHDRIISRPELGKDILGLQPRDKAAMLVVNTTELFHEENGI